MLTIKKPNEIALMKEAGRICSLAQEAVENAIKPGITTLELDTIAHNTIVNLNAVPSFIDFEGFKYTICTSINEECVHGIPSNRQLKNGDIISIDLGACYAGYHGDCSRTYPVGKVREDELKLIEITKQSLYAGLKFAKPGNRLSDISHAINEFVTANNYIVIKELTGHGIGKKLHEDPVVYHYGEKGCGPILKEGMTFAIEPVVTKGTGECILKDDNSTIITKDLNIASHYEETLVITNNGYEILTKH